MSASGLQFERKPTLVGIKSKGFKVGQIIPGIPLIRGTTDRVKLPFRGGSDNSRNNRVRPFPEWVGQMIPEYPGETIPGILRKAGQIISGIFNCFIGHKMRVGLVANVSIF